MKELSLEQFNPKKAEITKIVNKYKGLTINGIEDKKGYALVDSARKDLKKHRVSITNQGKDLRAEAISFQKQVIALADDLIGMIEPTEALLIEKQKEIDKLVEIEKRKVLLPIRKERLIKIGVNTTDDFINGMDNIQFEGFIQIKTSEFFARKEQIIEEEKEKIKIQNE